MAVSLAMVLCAASAMAWGSATHAYIDERINNKVPLLKLNQVYGGMATDVFNFMVDPLHPDYQPWLSTKVHCPDCSKMWHVSLLPTAKALTYGFISHNQAWGADFYAHNYSCPDNFPPTAGYIQEKAEALFPAIKPYLAALGLDEEQQQTLGMELLRDVIEYAVDILIIDQDKAIGPKVSAAALLRSPEFPLLLNAAYAQDFARTFHLNYFQATKIISTAELQFRQTMIGYGQILAQGKVAAVGQISAQLAVLAQQLFGIPLDPGLPGLIETVINIAMGQCAGDFMTAIDNGINATIDAVRIQMGLHGFIY
jgi:hypothetical protein